jgi:hypothetical protein
MAKTKQRVREQHKLWPRMQFWGFQALFYFVFCLSFWALPSSEALAVGLTAQVDRNVVPVRPLIFPLSSMEFPQQERRTCLIYQISSKQA